MDKPMPPPTRLYCPACGDLPASGRHPSWICRYFQWLDRRKETNTQLDMRKVSILFVIVVVAIAPLTFVNAFHDFVITHRVIALLLPFMYGAIVVSFFAWTECKLTKNQGDKND